MWKFLHTIIQGSHQDGLTRVVSKKRSKLIFEVWVHAFNNHIKVISLFPEWYSTPQHSPGKT